MDAVVGFDGTVTTIEGQATEFGVLDDGTAPRDGQPGRQHELAPERTRPRISWPSPPATCRSPTLTTTAHMEPAVQPRTEAAVMRFPGTCL